MIAGYNTDVRHDNVVFHVQTEDKGTTTPYIESLVYVGGQVLASKRADYADLLAEGRGNAEVVELMETQHRGMIAAIREGRFEEKVEAILGPRVQTESQPLPASTAPEEEEDVLVATKITEQDRTLDQVILEYLTSEAEQEQLLLVVEGEPQLAAGVGAKVALRATSSRSGRAVIGAHVMVKLISTVAEPRTLAVGETDTGGGLVLGFQVPDFGRGRAALIISGESTIGSAELKYLL